jgi:hypothetical protein
MIEETKAYRVGELVFPTIQEAQKSELAKVLHGLDDGSGTSMAEGAAHIIVENTDEIVAILTCQPVAKQKKVRSDKGKKRTPKAAATPEA